MSSSWTVSQLEGEKWKRWANTNVQEELCARAEALLLIEDAEGAARRLPDLMERWKTASEAEPDRSQALWQRFKVAADQVRARQDSLHAGNAEKKAALCDRAEALAGSTDWMGSAEGIKALQAEWKTVSMRSLMLGPPSAMNHLAA
jgi:TPP-dependent trihydroxycyclohexane-1,2-dione (THcHDO) dehydratase